MQTTVLILLQVLVALIPVFLAGRYRWYFAIPGLILFTPHLLSLGVMTADLETWLGGAELLTAQAGLLLAHACFAASLVFHFLYPHEPNRLEVLYVVPGQILFVAMLLYLPAAVLSLSGIGSIGETPTGFLIALGIATLTMLTTHRVRTESRQLEVTGLRSSLRIVQLTDVHVGTFMGDFRLQRLAKEINRLNPELIVGTGDYLTRRSERDYGAWLRFLRALDRPPLGIYACLGNHDLPVGRKLAADMEACGVRVLINEGETVALPSGEKLRIAGLNFYWRGRGERYPVAFEKARAGFDGPLLLLCHDPAGFDFLPEGWSGLMLAGHLHGGQVGLNLFGLHWSVLRPFSLYDYGEFSKQNARMYVHRGTGVYGFPVRIGIPAEFGTLDLVPAASERPSITRA